MKAFVTFMLYRVCWFGLAITGWVLTTIIIQEIIYARRAPGKKIRDFRHVSYHGPCRECRGDGVCRWCYGRGKVKGLLRRESVSCPYCGGSGVCPRCKGVSGGEGGESPASTTTDPGRPEGVGQPEAR